jgi:hypothetical protein
MTAPAPVDPATGVADVDPKTGTPDPAPAPAPALEPPKNDPAPAPQPTQDPPTSSGEGDKTDKSKTDQPAPKEEVDWKTRARQWEDTAKKNKTAAEERDQLKLTMEAIAAALDPNASKDLDPEEVAKNALAERDAKDAELRQLRVEQAAERAARRAGADVDALLDSRGFIKAIASLDPTADDFADRLGDAVDTALKTNPRLKAAAPAPTRTVPDPGGTRDTGGQLSRADLAHMKPEEIVEARKAGRLNSLLKGTSA